MTGNLPPDFDPDYPYTAAFGLELRQAPDIVDKYLAKASKRRGNGLLSSTTGTEENPLRGKAVALLAWHGWGRLAQQAGGYNEAKSLGEQLETMMHVARRSSNPNAAAELRVLNQQYAVLQQFRGLSKPDRETLMARADRAFLAWEGRPADFKRPRDVNYRLAFGLAILDRHGAKPKDTMP